MRAIWLGRQSYDEAHHLQTSIRDAVIAGQEESTLILLEHEPVITFGRRGPGDDLRADRDAIEARGIAFRSAERGGRTTYHGPGQLVGYIVAPLRQLAPDLPSYVWRIEEAMIRTAASAGVRAERCDCGHGAWIEGRKLGAVGVAVTRGVCWHGFALNVDPDLSAFDLIRPCGLDVEVTSLARFVQPPPAVESVAALIRAHLADCFGVEISVIGEPLSSICREDERLPVHQEAPPPTLGEG